MSEKLRELTEQLYNDGVQRARSEAARILEDAKKHAAELIAKAEADAQAIIGEGEKEAEALKSRVEGELALAARQAETTLKQQLVSLLADDILSQGVSDALADTQLMSQLIVTATDAWAKNGELQDVSLVISENDHIGEALNSALKGHLDRGLQIRFSGKMKDGFKLESTHGAYTISFTGDDFQQYFRSFLKKNIRDILFGVP